MKKNCLTVFLFCFLTLFSVQAQEKQELEAAIFKTITALNNKDEKALNAMILDDFGIAILFRVGVVDNLLIEKKISMENPIPRYLPYIYFGKIDLNQKVKHETLPFFDCNEGKFDKAGGIYCDVATNYNSISNVALGENEYLFKGWTEEQINEMKAIEKISWKIVAMGDKGTQIFFLTYYQNTWYLTMLDRFEVCSA